MAFVNHRSVESEMGCDVQSDICARPFVKWAGGKTSLLPTLLEHAPQHFESYFEPFVGGGALFFALREERGKIFGHLNDTNRRLMQTYAAVKLDVDDVIARLRRMKNTEAFFYRTRSKKTDLMSPPDLAAWYIYLNKTCFNGLYRVNKKGIFNVPYGYYKNPPICDVENLRACSTALRGVKLTSTDFVKSTAYAVEGDFVYFDPPYLRRVGHEFVAYGADHFGIEDHERLRDHALELKGRGVNVMISNSGAEPVREMYRGRKWKITEVQGARSIGASAHSRGVVPDLIIR